MKTYGLFTIGILPIVLLYLFFDPIPQSQSYHQFADQRHILATPNFWNVWSNLPFVLVALFGFLKYQKSSRSLSWLVFLIGIALVGPGSAYYHWAPMDQTLVWDRLPMTIGFMGLTSFILTEIFKLNWEKQLVVVLILTGFYSIAHWIYFQDLRVYAWVQLAPILMVSYCAVFFPSPILKPKYLIGAVFFYGLAKVLEHFDIETLHLTHGMSGHALKHLAAAVAILLLLKMNQTTSHHV